jgi:hypothetical protein
MKNCRVQSATLPEVQAAKAENMLKSSYFFETTEALALTKPLQERQVENDMVNRIKDVLMMLGKGFSFMGNQYVLSSGDNTYRIDLLFFRDGSKPVNTHPVFCSYF